MIPSTNEPELRNEKTKTSMRVICTTRMGTSTRQKRRIGHGKRRFENENETERKRGAS